MSRKWAVSLGGRGNPMKAASSLHEKKRRTIRSRRKTAGLAGQFSIEVIKRFRVVIVLLDGFNFLLFYLLN